MRENTRAGTLQYDIVPYIPRLIRRIGVKTCVGAAGVWIKFFKAKTAGLSTIFREALRGEAIRDVLRR